MKILFISDIHGIPTNLEILKELIIKEEFDRIAVLGDLYYCGPFHNNYDEVDINIVKDFLMSYKNRLVCVRGNCDSDVDIKVSDFSICDELALINVDGLNIYLTHGNKINKHNNKLSSGDILVFGHSHYPFITEEDGIVYMNPGSISVPRNGSKPGYMMYENKVFTIYSIDGEVIDKYEV